MKNKNKILVMVIGVLLVIVVGVSFAYFVATTQINGDGSSASLGTSNGIKVQYDAGSSKLETDSFLPSDVVSKGFKVIVTPTNNIESVTYKIYLNITENTFSRCNDNNYNEVTNDCEKDAEEIVYRLKDSEGNIIKSGDITDGVTGKIDLAIITKTPTTKTEYGYIIEIEYKETNKEQNHNKNAVINGEVKVEFAEPDTTKPIINNIEESVTKTEIKVTVDASDDKGVTEYLYQIDNNPVIKQTTNTYTFTGLTAGTTYSVKVYVKDAAGNQSATTTKSVTTKPEGQTSDTIIAGITVKDTTPNFATAATTDEGVFKVADPVYGGYSYYWRGAVTNNYVTFGGFCWRIVRINGDGSIRMIYDGTTCHANGTSTAESIAVASQKYNTSYNNSSYVGWTYTAGTQRTLSGTASNAKTQLEAWYTSSLASYASKIADGKYCNDRRTQNDEAWRATGATQYYAAYQRIVTNKQPTLGCDTGDIYTLKVGLITVDEVAYAGGVWGTNNNRYYLYNGQNYWTMSPTQWYSNYSSACVFFVNSDGYPAGGNVNFTRGLRPVINLKSDTTFAIGGNGTQSNPYVVS